MDTENSPASPFIYGSSTLVKLALQAGFNILYIDHDSDFSVFLGKLAKNQIRLDGVYIPPSYNPSVPHPEVSSNHDGLYWSRIIRFDCALVRHAYEHQIPFYGSCRGAHILATAYGGALKPVPKERRDLPGVRCATTSKPNIVSTIFENALRNQAANDTASCSSLGVLQEQKSVLDFFLQMVCQRRLIYDGVSRYRKARDDLTACDDSCVPTSVLPSEVFRKSYSAVVGQAEHTFAVDEATMPSVLEVVARDQYGQVALLIPKRCVTFFLGSQLHFEIPYPPLKSANDRVKESLNEQ
jgi:hypothetical protein